MGWGLVEGLKSERRLPNWPNCVQGCQAKNPGLLFAWGPFLRPKAQYCWEDPTSPKNNNLYAKSFTSSLVEQTYIFTSLNCQPLVQLKEYVIPVNISETLENFECLENYFFAWKILTYFEKFFSPHILPLLFVYCSWCHAMSSILLCIFNSRLGSSVSWTGCSSMVDTVCPVADRYSFIEYRYSFL